MRAAEIALGLLGPQPQRRDFVVGQGFNAASAPPSIGRIEALPERIIAAEYLAVQRPMAGAGAAVHHGDVTPPWPIVGVRLNHIP